MAIEKKYSYLLAVLVLTFVCLFPTLQNEWVNWDDYEYVLNNELVDELSFPQTIEVFSTPEVVGNYHPLTVLSLAVDYYLFEENAWGFHLTNLLLHLLVTALAFLFVHRLSNSFEAAAIVALLHGIHPMHVESVAWISARKDLLYTGFLLAAWWCYLRFLENKASGLFVGGRYTCPLQKDQRLKSRDQPACQSSGKNYFSCLLLFVCALLSKGMAVVFPLLLLLTDYLKNRKIDRKALLEKVPFFLLSLGFGIAAIITQQEASAIHQEVQLPLLQAIGLSGFSLLIYLVKAIAPLQLSGFHPLPEIGSNTLVLYCSLGYGFWLAILGVVWLARKKRRVVFGLAIFLVCLLPVLQILTVGKALTAERYTYLSYLGLFFLFAIWARRTFPSSLIGPAFKMRLSAKIMLTGTAFWMVALGFATFSRAAVWQNGDTFWSDVIDKYPNHYFAYGCRAEYWERAGQEAKTLADLKKSLNLNPGFAGGWNNLGRIYQKGKKLDSALAFYGNAIDADNAYVSAYINRAILLTQLGRNEEALEDFNQAISLDRGDEWPYINRGVLYEQMQNQQAAMADYNRALKISVTNALAYKYRGVLKFEMGDLTDAFDDLSEAISLNPDFGAAWYCRAKVQHESGNRRGALNDLEKARELNHPVERDFVIEMMAH